MLSLHNERVVVLPPCGGEALCPLAMLQQAYSARDGSCNLDSLCALAPAAAPNGAGEPPPAAAGPQCLCAHTGSDTRCAPSPIVPAFHPSLVPSLKQPLTRSNRPAQDNKRRTIVLCALITGRLDLLPSNRPAP